MSLRAETIDRLVQGQHSDPFAALGPHQAARSWAVRTLQPQADKVELVNPVGEVITELQRIHPNGLYEGRMEGKIQPYRLRLQAGNHRWEIDDPYRFPSPLGELDRHLMAEGTHRRLHDTLGARPIELEGVGGVYFSVWAPNARRVSVVGPFNDWDGRRHPMRLHPGNGVWDIFVPGLGAGELYKFELLGADGNLQPLKADPFARAMEPPPGNASIVHESRYVWGDADWLQSRGQTGALDAPMNVYELHLGSWRRGSENRWLSYHELADQLIPYVLDLGYTHIELLPVTEHPFDGSWGYQPIGLFAPTWRFGDPDAFRYFVDRCHQAGIGVIMDWVPAHFPKDAHGLGRFDGTHLYEHADPRQGEHPDWGTLVFNFGRPEVSNYLVASALCWVEDFHIDALRVDAVASMLYLDYSRGPGQWLPNRYGGNENLEAIAFLRRMNEVVHEVGGFTIAEESTAWPMVSRPTWLGGLGFTYKWNMGWMHDTLSYMQEDPVYRKYHHDQLTFSLVYAFSENFVLALSHDEVVHGKGSLLGKMPGDTWQKFANLRTYYSFMIAHPGKKLLFMGSEFGQGREWNHDGQLEWWQLETHWHAGILRLSRDLNHLYRELPALYQIDFEDSGFQWIDGSDRDQSVIAFLRRGRNPEAFVVAIFNFTPVVREGYRIGVPTPGVYRERLNSDAEIYGGSGVGNGGSVTAEEVPWHGQQWSLNLTLPPLGGLILCPG